MLENAGEYIYSPEIIARKIKAAVIANKKVMEFQNAATSDCEDSDDSLYMYPYQDVDISDPEPLKIALCKALPDCTSLTLGLASFSQNCKELRCPCSKDMTDWTNIID